MLHGLPRYCILASMHRPLSLSVNVTHTAWRCSASCCTYRQPCGCAMQHWGFLIEAAEEPLPLSCRDGRLLRLVPANQRLSRDELTLQLQAALTVHQVTVDARSMLVAAWQRARSPGRAAVALMRGYAYLQDGQLDLANRVRTAPAHVANTSPITAGIDTLAAGSLQGIAPTSAPESQQACAPRAVTSADQVVGPTQDALFALTYGPQRGGKPSWARGHALRAAVLEALTDNTSAALAYHMALEQRAGVPLWQAALERLLRRIPDSHAAALQVQCCLCAAMLWHPEE